MLCICALGSLKLTAFSRLATNGAYVLSRLHPQTTRLTMAAGRWQPVELARWLPTAAGQRLERPIFLGAKERLASRLIASRVPAAIVHERRRKAKKKAKKKGYTPSPAHLTRMAWNLFMTNVPHTRWKTDTVVNVYPVRWQIELIFKSWKSDLHVAVLTTTTADTTLCYLYGRMLLMVLTYGLCPQMRAHLWSTKKRELSRLKLVRHFQALAASWMQAIVQSELAWRRFLTHACHTAERLVAKALRIRRTTAQILRANLSRHEASSTCAEAVNA
jgi:hypothetical protein